MGIQGIMEAEAVKADLGCTFSFCLQLSQRNGL